MTGPGVPESMSLDEMQDMTPQKTNLGDMKLDGDDVPEHLRGKSAADLIKLAESAQEAVKLSENARLQAEARAAAAGVQQPATLPEPKPEPELTEEELAELHQQDPLKAIRYIQTQAQRAAERNFEARLGSVVAGTASQVENAARAKYKDEFELFGDQITSVAKTIPNAQQVLMNPSAWDDLISLIRGRSGNIERLIERKSAQPAAPSRRAAADMEAQSMGFSDTGQTGRRPASNPSQLDSIQLEIAEKLNMTPAEYVHWSNVGTKLS